MGTATIEHTHVGAYAIITDASSILLIKKARGPYTGSFDLPGGSFEFGESPVEAATREVLEETGLTVAAATLTEPFSCVFEYSRESVEHRLHHIGFIYLRDCDPSDLRSTGDDLDAAEARFIPCDTARQLPLSPFAEKALDLFASRTS